MPEPEHPALLKPSESIAIPPAESAFDIRERFEKPGRILLASVWNEFKKRFYGKIEPVRGGLALRKYNLLHIAPDAPIIAELGGHDAVECPVGAAFYLIGQQARGQAGILQTNGFANIFYSRDIKGCLCAIRVGWDGEGWVVDAISVEDPLAWNGKHEIFCPVR